MTPNVTKNHTSSSCKVMRLVRRQYSVRLCASVFEKFFIISTDIVDEFGAWLGTQCHSKQAAGKSRILTARVIEDIDLRIVLLCDFAHYGQPQSAAFHMAAQNPIKTFENMRAFRLRN